MTRISPSNHADTVLVHEPAISLTSARRLGEVQTVNWEAYEDANADDSVEISEVLSHIVLRSVEKRKGQCANQHSDVEVRNPSWKRDSQSTNHFANSPFPQVSASTYFVRWQATLWPRL